MLSTQGRLTQQFVHDSSRDPTLGISPGSFDSVGKPSDASERSGSGPHRSKP